MWICIVKKNQNRYFCEKLNYFIWDQLMSSSFRYNTPPQKYQQEKTTCAPEKHCTFKRKKTTSKRPKNNFCEMEFSLPTDKRSFHHEKQKWVQQKVDCHNYIWSRVKKCAHFVSTTFLKDIIICWTLDKNHTLFRTVNFAQILWWEVLGRTILSRFLKVLNHAWQVKVLTHQPEKLVNQNGDINEG